MASKYFIRVRYLWETGLRHYTEGTTDSWRGANEGFNFWCRHLLEKRASAIVSLVETGKQVHFVKLIAPDQEINVNMPTDMKVIQ